MATTVTGPIYTTAQAAAKLGVTDARVRQLCIGIGTIGRKHGKSWWLTDEDLRILRARKREWEKSRNLS